MYIVIEPSIFTPHLDDTNHSERIFEILTGAELQVLRATQGTMVRSKRHFLCIWHEYDPPKIWIWLGGVL